MSRLVLDTNVLISALVFRDSRHQPLREAWQAGALVPLLSAGTFDELKRVLTYPMFGLDELRIASALTTLEPFIEWVNIDEARVTTLRRCSDRDDQKFLETALCGNADALLTYDRALLKMRRRMPFPVLQPEQWSAVAAVAGRNGTQ